MSADIQIHIGPWLTVRNKGTLLGFFRFVDAGEADRCQGR
jgi:hypothetical protein